MSFAIVLVREIHKSDEANTAEINALEYFQTSCYMHIPELQRLFNFDLISMTMGQCGDTLCRV